MAATGNTQGDPADYGEHDGMDIGAHRASYERFLGWFKWGAVVSFVVAAGVVVLIAS